MLRYLLISFCLIYTNFGEETCSNSNQLRLNPELVNTTWSQSGRLEICFCDVTNCTWSPLATTDSSGGWSWTNVQVACKQLGVDTGLPFTGLGNPIFSSSSPNGSDIYSSLFTCDGTEATLSNCNQSPLLSTDNVFEVYITCSKIVSTGHVRLSGSTVPHQGAIEVYVRATGQWETVCVDNFHDAEADVICRTLGYGSGTLVVLSTSTFSGDSIIETPSISGIVCTGSERDIDSCFFTRSTTCSRTGVLAGASCVPTVSGTGSARLFSLSTFNDYQRVEVLYGGRWGSICETAWDHTDGLVTCASLNRPIDDTELPSDFVSIIASQRPIWVYGYHCNGSETNLTACSLVNDYPIGYAPGCNHTHDAGLFCAEIPSTGLSAGAIAGIVIGTLCGTCCLVIIGAVIVFFLYVYCCDGDNSCDVDCDCDCFSCFKSRGSSGNRFGGEHEGNIDIDLEERYTTSSSEMTEEEIIVKEEEDKRKELKDTELSKPAPPSYNDALNLEGVTTLPGYTPPPTNETPPPTNDTNNESDELLPYPVIDSDPAYPPPHATPIILTSTSTDV